MTHAQGADTLISVLADASAAGYTATFVPESGAAITCRTCDTRTPASALEVASYRRLEGASDAADMMLVALTHCPACGARGPITVGYGPNAHEYDADLLGALDLRDAESGPVT